MTKLYEERTRQLCAKTVSLSPMHNDEGNRNSEDRPLAGAAFTRKLLGQQADDQVLS